MRNLWRKMQNIEGKPWQKKNMSGVRKQRLGMRLNKIMAAMPNEKS
jgi:hypothetical protein